jgi:hypothetical protein
MSGARVLFAGAIVACGAVVAVVHRMKDASRERMHRAVEADRELERRELLEEAQQRQRNQQHPNSNSKR